MDLNDLSLIIAEAKRSREYEHEYCVLLNGGTYMRLLRAFQSEAYKSMLITPPRGATFEYYGCTVSWTPALDNFPEGAYYW